MSALGKTIALAESASVKNDRENTAKGIMMIHILFNNGYGMEGDIWSKEFPSKGKDSSKKTNVLVRVDVSDDVLMYILQGIYYRIDPVNDIGASDYTYQQYICVNFKLYTLSWDSREYKPDPVNINW